MCLADALYRYPTETRADLQRFYGLDLDKMGTEYTVEHAAACVSCMPPGALFARVNKGYGLLLKDLPVKSITDAFRKPIDPSEIEYGSMSVDDFDAWLKSKEAR